MRGHIGFRIPPRAFNIYLTYLSQSVLLYRQPFPEIRVTQLTQDMLLFKIAQPEVRITQTTQDVLIFQQTAPSQPPGSTGAIGSI